MEHRTEIRLSGSGGQGIILAAVILAEAAGVYEGLEVCQSQSYGPEARGGKSRADVIVSTEPIDYPMAMELDILLSLNQASCDAYFPLLKNDGLLIVDAAHVRQVPTDRAISLPFQQLALEKAKNPQSANMAALGALVALSGIVRTKSLESALNIRAPKGTIKSNLQALRAGIRAASQTDLKALPPFLATEEEEV